MKQVTDFFTSEDITAGRLILAGYKLFPCTVLELHPRMTVLSGNNAVGKTTILDALQSILIAHQKYINLNVASGQNDRGLAGQLADRVGWAVLTIKGHNDVKALGVRLYSKVSQEQTELFPFAIEHFQPGPDIFVDQESRIITPDFQALKKKVLEHSLEGKVTDFTSLEEYHQFLFDQGLLPMPLSGKGKRKFAALWRQVTTPRLKELDTFLQEMLCPDPSQSIKFADVEKLMQDRRSIDRQLKQLREFREIRQELENGRQQVEELRRLYLGTSLSQAEDRIGQCRRQQEESGRKEKDVRDRLAAINSNLEELEAERKDLHSQRDKYYEQKTSLSVKLRHHQEFRKAGEELDRTGKEKQELDDSCQALRREIEGLAEKKETLAGESEQKNRQISRLEEQEKTWLEKKKRYESLKKLLDRTLKVTGQEIASRAELLQIWPAAVKEYNELNRLPELKDRLRDLNRRVADHERARETAQQFCRRFPETGSPEDLDRDNLEKEISTWEELDFNPEIRELETERQQYIRELYSLEQGRPPLPDHLEKMVEKGRIRPVAWDFEDLDLKEAGRIQACLGPFARGVRLHPGQNPSELAGGSEIFFLLAPDWKLGDLQSEDCGQGLISGRGAFRWYAPGSPVWLGAKARARQIEIIREKEQDSAAKIDQLKARQKENSARINQGRKLLGLWSALLDRQAPKAAEELAARIERLENDRPVIQEKYRLLSDLITRQADFDLRQAPKTWEQIRRQLTELREEAEADRKKLEEVLAQSREREKDLEEKTKQRDEAVFTLIKLKERLEYLRQEEPEEVLEGRIDFSGAEELEARIRRLNDKEESLNQSYSNLNQERGRKEQELQYIQDQITRIGKDLAKSEAERQEYLDLWRSFCPEEEPWLRPGTFSREDCLELKSRWESARDNLQNSVNRISHRHHLDLRTDRALETQVDHLLGSLIPSHLDLDRVEERFQHLQRELKEIEEKIRSYVQEIRQRVDLEISRLKRRLNQVNSILAGISFGRIKQVKIEMSYLPAYEGLKNLKGQQLNLLNFESQVTLQDFIQELIKTIFRHSRARISEDQIADYRTYVRLGWSIVDDDGQERHRGFSSGETLGINLSICLGLLFYWGQETGRARSQGLLLMGLDEAERLDEKALLTVRGLLDRVGCQLLVALPRTLQVPSSLCHLLTPLPQGVTHVSVFHKESEEEARRTE